MITDLFSQKLQQYNISNPLEEQNALQEIVQQYILFQLAKIKFFNYAFFQGGTCLRIFFNLERFSEDLDFRINKANAKFAWQPFLEKIHQLAQIDGLNLEIADKSRPNQAVQKAFIKTNNLNKKLRIKLEIDTNPPQGSETEIHYLTFPGPATVPIQTLSSGLATKLHALLCQPYTKGRD